ncbi:Panacea domain-containing protein [Filimonas effusa]|uniref:DUF4065 domain-containing protein n=1 Tax=Filimonas effusa TaxID=2508721 RepID=A0A4Q1D443_9BACT|nr:type II toxin-antitoxin system antitoxin SocA domain-containing protein [Filimonas effusa]RXK83195.1 DUF4065 domain-containing protein [Filimonas effusa]
MSYPASLIAYYLVKKGIEEGNPLSQMKLQKMVYFAHGIHMALHKEALVSEKFQAWKFGPVVPDIYHAYKLYGSDPIASTEWVVDHNAKEAGLSLLNEEAIKTLDFTWDSLKDFNAIKLSNWTHQPGSPWSKNYNPNINDIAIPNTEIADYFKQFVVTNEE